MKNLPPKFCALLLAAMIPGCFVSEPDEDDAANDAETEGEASASDTNDDEPGRETAQGESSDVDPSMTGADDGDGSSDDGIDPSATGAITTDGSDDGGTGGSDDSAGDASATGGETGVPEGGTELLENGSFEDWSSGSPTAWNYGDAALDEIVGGAADGDRAARVSSPIYASVGQAVNTPLAAGSCLAFDVAVRWESDSTEAPLLLLQGSDGGANEYQMFMELDWSADGEWHATTGTSVVNQDWASMTFSIVSTASVAQVFAVDDASLRLVPCE